MLLFLAGVACTIGAFVVMLAILYWYTEWYFPRDPVRQINGSARIIAPADGRVIYVKEVKNGVVPISVKRRREIPLNEIVKGCERSEGGVLIGIYLSPLDVHYQRSPITGVVKEVVYHRAPKNHAMASMFVRNCLRIHPIYRHSPHIWNNERNVIRIANDEDDMYVVQIADRIIHRIDWYVQPGDAVEKGQKIGMIRGGSQVDLFIRRAKIDDVGGAQVGKKVFAGESAISTTCPTASAVRT